MKNYYEVLGVPHDASQQDIKSAYRKLVLAYHPDRNRQDEQPRALAEEKFKSVTEAYETLGSEDKRRHYDFVLNRAPTATVDVKKQDSSLATLRGTCDTAYHRFRNSSLKLGARLFSAFLDLLRLPTLPMQGKRGFKTSNTTKVKCHPRVAFARQSMGKCRRGAGFGACKQQGGGRGFMKSTHGWRNPV